MIGNGGPGWMGGPIRVSAYRNYPWWMARAVQNAMVKIVIIAFLAGMITQCQVSGESDTQKKLKEAQAQLKACQP
jgi:hypothetical protein